MRNALRAHLFASVGPAESLSKLSRLVAVQEPDAFATIICAEIDLRSGDVVWASAGHPAPVLVSGAGTSAHLLGQPAPPIGWANAASSEPLIEHRFTLRPGDRLLMFTDGLLERRGVHFDIGLTHLMILAEQTRDRANPADACGEILRGMLPEAHEDDVCLMIADFS